MSTNGRAVAVSVPQTRGERRERRRLWHAAVAGVLVAAFALSAGPLVAQAGIGSSTHKPVLTLEEARIAAAAAAAQARRVSAPGGAIAVVDDGGHLVFLLRLDHTFPAAPDIATAKARTAALFRRPTKTLEDVIVGGRATLLNVADAPLQGGVPLLIGGQVVGAIGVSGAASAAQDTELAVAGAVALHQ